MFIECYHRALINPGDEEDEFVPLQSTRAISVVNFEIPPKNKNVRYLYIKTFIHKFKKAEIIY